MTNQSKLIVALCGLGLLTAPFMMGSSPSSEEIFVNRQWISHIPQEDTDLVDVLLFAEFDQGNGMGLTAKVSQWRHHQDLFWWEAQNGRVKSTFPQHGIEERFSFKAYECDDAPPPFELCLEVNEEMYYSRWEWTIDAANEAELKNFSLTPPE